MTLNASYHISKSARRLFGSAILALLVIGGVVFSHPAYAGGNDKGSKFSFEKADHYSDNEDDHGGDKNKQDDDKGPVCPPPGAAVPEAGTMTLSVLGSLALLPLGLRARRRRS